MKQARASSAPWVSLALAGGSLGGLALARELGWGRGERSWQDATGWAGIPAGDRARIRSSLWASDDAPQLHWLGHSGFLLSWHGIRVVVDPHAGPCCTLARRQSVRPLEPALWPEIDAALVTHAHFDHLDPRTLRDARPKVLVVPSGCERWLPRDGRLPEPQAVDVWETLSIGDLEITAVPARHNGSRAHPLASRELAVGWVVQAGGDAVYFAGDTGDGPHFAEVARRFQPRVAVLPIGAFSPRVPLRWFHLAPREAAAASHLLGVETVVPSHFGTFRLSLDRPDTALPRFARAARDLGVDWLLAPLLSTPRALVGPRRAPCTRSLE